MSNCPLCRLLLSALENVNTIDSAEFCILREGSALKVRGGPQLLRICSNSGMSAFLSLSAYQFLTPTNRILRYELQRRSDRIPGIA